MPATYTELFYHLVWATKGRRPIIVPEMEEDLYRYIRHKCEQMGALVHALGGMEEHIHLAASVPARIALADFTERVKGASAHFINHIPDQTYQLYWQTGYGALTFSKRDLPRVVEYICSQKTHHGAGTLKRKLEYAGE